MSKIKVSKEYLQYRFKNIDTIDARTDLGKLKKRLYHEIYSYNGENINTLLNNLYYLEDQCRYIIMNKSSKYIYINKSIILKNI